MRVITGSVRGKKLETLEGADVRPTTDRVKEAVFSIIQFRIEGRNFLDLFAGSGQMGIEALSRGAQRAVFVDVSSNAAAVVKRNLNAVGFMDKAKQVKADAVSFLKTVNTSFDIAYLDPPYKSDLIKICLPLVAEKMNKGGIIVCETALDAELPTSAYDFKIDRVYRYGKIKITTYTTLNKEEPEN